MVTYSLFIGMQKADSFRLGEYRSYREFLDACANKIYDSSLVLHKHHIIPKHLWYNEQLSVNNLSNITLLSVDDHVQAHLLLAKCYDEDTYEHIMNLRAARVLSRKSIKDKSILDEISKTYRGVNNAFYGKKHSTETRKKLAEKTRLRRTGRSYEDLYGPERAEQEKRKRAKKTRTDEQYREAAKKTSAKMKGKLVGEKNGSAQPYSVDGILFGCKADLLSYFGISMYLLEKQKNVIRISKQQYDLLKKQLNKK
jgi:hypothetical protein